jgi:hypothetical protein
VPQPKWTVAYQTDDYRVYVDERGLYPAEMEVAVDLSGSDTLFAVYRFPLEPFKRVVMDRDGVVLVPRSWCHTWPHPLTSYEPWFKGDLPAAAALVGTTVTALHRKLCSDDVLDRVEVYRAIGDYHGYANLDSEPQTLTREELDERWKEAE